MANKTKKANDIPQFSLETEHNIRGANRACSCLCVQETSTSYELENQKGVGRIDALMAIPMLLIDFTGRCDIGTIVSHIGALLLRDGMFPIGSQASKGMHFNVSESRLTILSEANLDWIFGTEPIKIDKRLAWFLDGTKTLSLVIRDGERLFVSTIVAEDNPPLVSSHFGALAHTGLEKLIAHSKAWKFGVIGNQSYTLGNAQFDDDHFDSYTSFRESGKSLPKKLSFEKGCLACGRPATSNEHCTPKWVCDIERVEPVTSQLFCADCNSYFGENLENPISKYYRRGDLVGLISDSLFNQWAIKTAITLSVASGVLVQESWMRDLRKGRIPEGFEVYALPGVRLQERGYMYCATYFSSKRRREGYFLTTFAVTDLIFVVVHPAGLLEKLELLPRIYPSNKRGSDMQKIDISLLHMKYMEELTGVPLEFIEGGETKPQSR